MKRRFFHFPLLAIPALSAGGIVIRKGSHLTCTAGHRCAVFLRDLEDRDHLSDGDLLVIQENFRLRIDRIIPPCFECGRVVTVQVRNEQHFCVDGEWVPKLRRSDLELLQMMER